MDRLIDSFIQMFDGLTDSLTDRQMDCLVAFDSVAEVEVVVLIQWVTLSFVNTEV